MGAAVHWILVVVTTVVLGVKAGTKVEVKVEAKAKGKVATKVDDDKSMGATRAHCNTDDNGDNK